MAHTVIERVTVVPGRGRPVLPSATVSLDAAGRVTAIDPDPGAPPYDPAPDDMPTGSLLLVPAAVDLHLDNLVQRRRPRAGVTLDHAAVITALDAECAASGIATVCVAARCEHSPRKGIDIADAARLAAVVEDLMVEFVSGMSGAGAIMGSFEQTQKLLAAMMPEDKVNQLMEEIRGPAGRTTGRRDRESAYRFRAPDPLPRKSRRGRVRGSR